MTYHSFLTFGVVHGVDLGMHVAVAESSWLSAKRRPVIKECACILCHVKERRDDELARKVKGTGRSADGKNGSEILATGKINIVLSYTLYEYACHMRAKRGDRDASFSVIGFAYRQTSRTIPLSKSESETVRYDANSASTSMGPCVCAVHLL